MAIIRCCKDCIPPKRHIGCHADCKEYIKEKAQLEEDKKKEKENNKTVSISSYDFNKIAYGNKRKKR